MTLVGLLFENERDFEDERGRCEKSDKNVHKGDRRRDDELSIGG